MVRAVRNKRPILRRDERICKDGGRLHFAAEFRFRPRRRQECGPDSTDKQARKIALQQGHQRCDRSGSDEERWQTKTHGSFLNLID